MADKGVPPHGDAAAGCGGTFPASSSRRAYDLQGCTLGIISDGSAVGAFLDPILAPRASDIWPCDWTVSVARVATIEPPSTGTCLFEGTLPEGLPAIIVEQDGKRNLAVADHFAIELDEGSNTVACRYIEGQANWLGGTAALWLLSRILAAHTQYLLHGAAVVDPRSGDAVVFFAPSGTGKTTTVLALARAGFPLLSDDALVLSMRDGAPVVWAFPRRLKVSQHTASMLRWLEPILTEAWTDGEQAVERHALASSVPLAGPEPRRIARVIVLRPPNDRDHRLTPIARPDALTAIAHDNVRVGLERVEPDQAAAFAALSMLIATTPVAALSPGPNPDTLATQLFER